MSLEATYIRASNSSHLEWRPTVADIDRVVAAGLVRESLATRLMRLRAEFDSISAGTPAKTMVRLLNGFAVAHEAMTDFVGIEAARQRRAALVTPEMTNRVLGLFLDPNCPMCDGRGFNGSYGSPMLRCTACRESGKRALYWKTDAEQEFADWLMASIDSKIARALGEMRKVLA